MLFREPSGNDGLTFVQERTVREYVQEHLRERISLDDLAASVALSRFTSPADSGSRSTRARTSSWSAFTCGFADQSHLNRVFKGYVGTTPGRFRERR